MNLEGIMNNREEKEQTAIGQAKQVIGERINYDLITMENAALKEQLWKFAADLMKFQTLISDTMCQSEQKNLDFSTEMRRSLQEKMTQLESSNQVISETIQAEVEQYIGAMENLVKWQMGQYEGMLKDINYAGQRYVNKVTQDIDAAQNTNRRYWFHRQQINYAIWGYLVLSPALIIIEMLSRYFHWF